MAIQIINDPGRRTISESFTSGLGNILQGLAQQKAEEIKTARGLEALNSQNASESENLSNVLKGLVPQESQPLQQPKQFITPEKAFELARYLQTSSGQESFTPEQRVIAAQALAKSQQLGGAPRLQSQQQPKLATPAIEPVKQNQQKLRQMYDFIQPKTAKERSDFLKYAQSFRGGENFVDPKQQLKIESANKKFLDKMTEYVSSAKKRKELAQQALDLVKAGKVTSGLKGLLPESLLTTLNADDASFVTLVSQLANEKALELRGPVGQAKLAAAQRTKASLNQPKEAQEEILMREIKEANKAESLEKAYEDILAEHGGTQPSDIETKIRKRAKELESNESIEESVKKDSSTKKFAKLPKASELPGKRVKFPDGSIRKSNGKEWVKE